MRKRLHKTAQTPVRRAAGIKVAVHHPVAARIDHPLISRDDLAEIPLVVNFDHLDVQSAVMGFHLAFDAVFPAFEIALLRHHPDHGAPPIRRADVAAGDAVIDGVKTGDPFGEQGLDRIGRLNTANVTPHGALHGGS